MILKRIILPGVIALGLLIATPVFAANSFIVRGIRIVGLQRYQADTIRRYLPIQVGKRFSAGEGAAVIHALYDTGFFQDVSLSRRGGLLIIHVQERPTIARIRIEGNKTIKSKQLEPVLKNLGITVGSAFDSNKFNEVVQGMGDQYHNMGFQAVSVNPRVVKEPRNRVSIFIKVDEGKASTVHSIKFEGNRSFSSFRLRSQMNMTTPGLLTWFTHKDRFSNYLLGQDLVKLRKFYLNRGYLKAVVTVRRITRGLKGVDILIDVHEGARYRISGFQVSGVTHQQDAALLKLVDLQVGGYFSQKDIVRTRSAISDYFGNLGYAFPRVQPIPHVNEMDHTVSFDFHILSGAKVYVRMITVAGNKRTRDIVLRRELRQMEGGLYSASQVARSKQRLMLLGFFEKADVDIKPVPGHSDLVDLTFNVKEMQTGKAQVQGGWDSSSGFVYGASVSEKNFMGTGDAVAVGFQNSEVVQSYNFSVTQPYYLPNGMSRSFSIYYTKVKNKPKFNLDSSYQLDGFGGSVGYGLPLTEHSSMSFAFGYDRVNINHVITDPADVYVAAPSVLSFLDLAPGQNSKSYNNFKVVIGWGYSSLDRALFPTKGFATGASAEVGAPVMSSSNRYYIGSASARWYQPIWKGFVFNLHANAQYGSGYGKDSRLPFFKNFYLGGIGSVPGYESNSLGPWSLSSGTALGGNMAAVFGANIILPEFISPKVRTAVMLSAGNVFQVPRYGGDVADPNIVNVEKFRIKNLRTSVGFMVQWYSPMGIIDLSFAKPLNKKKNDQSQIFQFSFGTTF